MSFSLYRPEMPKTIFSGMSALCHYILENARERLFFKAFREKKWSNFPYFYRKNIVFRTKVV